MAKNCINPGCGKEIPSSATFCPFCGAQQVEDVQLSEEEKMRKEMSEMQETVVLLKKALADAQQNSDSSAENVQAIENLQKQLADMQNKALQNSVKNPPKRKSKNFSVFVWILGLTLLLVGGLVGYFAFYKPPATNHDACVSPEISAKNEIAKERQRKEQGGTSDNYASGEQQHLAEAEMLNNNNSDNEIPTKEGQSIEVDRFSEFMSLFPIYSSWEAIPEDVRDITVPDKTLDEENNYQIYPLARVRINDSIYMFLLLYDGSNAPEKNLYYEAYTFNTSKKQVLSSLTLFKDSEMLFSYIKQGRNICIYENDSSKLTIMHKIYHLGDDGYLQLHDNDNLMNGKRIAAFTIVDPDGYTNVREEPATQSKILYRIKEGFGGILEITDNPNWYRVIYSKEGGGEYPDKNNFIKGWIHKSRVCFKPGRYGWEKGEKNVCEK
jgi:hypothetical protein